MLRDEATSATQPGLFGPVPAPASGEASGGPEFDPTAEPRTPLQTSKDAELAHLGPAQRQYVSDNFGALLDHGARLGVSMPEGNGGQPVLTLQDGRLQQMLADNPDLRYNVHTHYHGAILPKNPKTFDKNTVANSMASMWQKDPTHVFVLPQTQVFGAAKDDQPIGNQWGHAAWSNVSNEKTTTEDALAEAGLDPTRAGSKTVSGHSAGGYPLADVMASTAHDPSHPTMDADHILILDTVRGDMAPVQGLDGDEVSHDNSVPDWWRTNHPGAITYVDGIMHSFSPSEAGNFGWNEVTIPPSGDVAKDHFDAVQSYLTYGS
jgi:hypothetical protein